MIPLVDLFTIGYQGRSVEGFLSVLAEHEIEVLIDVRYTPWSHKPGFTRARLVEALSGKRIRYIHLPEFGATPKIRQELRTTGDWEEFARAYVNGLRAMNGVAEGTLAPLKGRRVCLLCMEADPQQCHRSLLARQLVERGIASKPTHL